jgi:hypothetical protein
MILKYKKWHEKFFFNLNNNNNSYFKLENDINMCRVIYTYLSLLFKRIKTIRK